MEKKEGEQVKLNKEVEGKGKQKEETRREAKKIFSKTR